MHPLRFPNSGIRAKIFMRKIGFKLHVKRLNRVKSFYAFLLHFRSKRSECKGQPGMATSSPPVGAAGHLQGGRSAAAKASLQGGNRLWPARRGGRQRLPTVCPQGTAPAASRGGCRRARAAAACVGAAMATTMT
ncbi:hypothetical protein GW17_00028621 [Ensete ventricosum]|nr:hypothetical protein GW17_00028621 [Ensete ventricosum]